MAEAYFSNGEATPGSDSSKPTTLTASASFKSRKKISIARAGSEVDDFINLLHGSDPVKFELNRLENDVRVSEVLLLLISKRFSFFFFIGGSDKDRELGDAHAEIKALKYSERLREKAVEEAKYYRVIF
ncbi:hypothetical protein HHK36_017884 [Tetracentron sinense]|uniref:Uncharacterized protein n=1 Tax=Tetracentron sinense TaxID=13715 RepID=A0A834YV08_TETSI|nr:hypothetical protein HHK36_017884 [Tetracentron sinense]